MKVLEDIVELIRLNDRFLITSHERPDGDSIGSELALAAGLRLLGKKADVINADPHPRNCRSLPGIDSIVVTRSAKGAYEILFVLECTSLERSGIRGLEHLPAINIDHHPKNDCFGELNWVDTSASAVGMMIFELLKRLNVPITAEVATNLYVALLTDTGSFQFSNTTAETFAVARELVAAGADPGEIAQSVIMSQSASRLRLLSSLLSTLDFDPTHRIAWIRMDRSMLESTGATSEDTEGLVNYPLSVEGVLLCAFFRQEGKRSYRVSLRSKNGLDVGSVAETFGGGGHRNAAGLSLEGSFEEVRKKIISRLEYLLDLQPQDGS
jgi:phosphoesterase RecJ-like protein